MQIRESILLKPENLNKFNQTNQRNEEEFKLIEQLISDNEVFVEYPQPPQIINQISKRVKLMWSQLPHVEQIKQNQVYLILEGKCFEYIQNNQANGNNKLDNNNQYLMVRKLDPNSFFLVYSPQTKYKYFHLKKYHLMVDQKTLIAKVSDDTFMRYFFPVIEARWIHYAAFFRKVQLFMSVPQIVLYELTHYIRQIKVQKGSTIIAKGIKSQFVYFIKEGEVEVRKHRDINKPQQTPNSNYLVTHKSSYLSLRLKKYDFFGMESYPELVRGSQSQDNCDNSIESLTNTILFRVDKRLLAIVITSFEQQFKKRNKIWSSVNLNQQIQGQGYQSSELKELVQNADRIRTSERKSRDIKLRYLQSKKKPRKQEVQIRGFLEKKSNQETDKIQNQRNIRKFPSTSHFNRTKGSLGQAMAQTYSSNFHKDQWANDFTKKLSSIFISPIEEDNIDPYTETKYKASIFKINNPRIYSRNQSTGKLESDLIRAYLDKRSQNQLLSKNELVKNRKLNHQSYQVKNLRRSNSVHIKSVKQQNRKSQTEKQQQIGEQLYQRMAKLNENPLLFRIQNQRKKIQFLQLKVTKSAKPVLKIDKKIKKQDEMILIRQN